MRGQKKGQQRQRSDEEIKEREGVEDLKILERCCTPHTSPSRAAERLEKDVRKSKQQQDEQDSARPHLLMSNGGPFPRLRNSSSCTLHYEYLHGAR